ncbi:MAG: PH domain-containing protein [Anaerolineales bacterium]|nr:PH domain-containing protein [Anaerolineales bacterium]
MSSKAEFLGSLKIFKELHPDELRALAEICPEYEFDTGASIAYQRDVANSLYIVRSGRLFASTVDERGIVRESKPYTPGEYFDDRWLFTPMAHKATVRATEPGRVIIIDGPTFVRFLANNRDIVDALEPYQNEKGEQTGLSEEAWETLVKSEVAASEGEFRAAGLMPDELVEYWTRRSRWVLWFNIFFRVLLLLLWVGIYSFLAARYPLLATNVGTLLLFIIPGLLLGFFILYSFLDWRNDYLLITNKQVLHYEFSLNLRSFGTNIQKLPIDRIQSVTIEQPNFISNLLNLGTVRITTASQSSTIVFDFVNTPLEVKNALDRISRRVKELDAGHEQALMRRSLEDHFQLTPPVRKVTEEETQQPAKGRRGRRFELATRLEEGGTVTYRKSRIFLLLEMRWPLILGAGLLLVYYLLQQYTSSPLLALPFGILLLLDLGWLIWEIEDWRNDQYQVDDRYVIDIDRTPFGFGGTRRQAELSNIQNVNASRPGFLATIFRYGTVFIETAGASADIAFERVTNPNQVQQDIFNRRERLQRQQAEAASAQRRKEYALVLDVYQQITEQGRVPRRTASLDANPDNPPNGE